MRYIVPLLLPVVVWAMVASAALAAPSTASDVIRTVLPNGMVVILKPVHTNPVATVRAYVRTGYIYEGTLLGAGVSHFCEHLVGQVTPTKSYDDLRKIRQELGGQSNAYTTTDHTCYHMTTSRELYPRALELVIRDWLVESVFTDELIARERGVIHNEMNMRNSEPGPRLYELFQRTCFTTHPVKHPGIGYPELFDAVSRDDLEAYRHATYIPNNMFVVCAGDFDPDSVLAIIQELVSDYPRGKPPSPIVPEEPLQMKRRYAEEEADVVHTHLMIGYHTVPIHHPDIYPLDILEYILTEGRGARLKRILRDEKQLVHTIRSQSHTPAYDAGVFTVSATLDDEKLHQVESAILGELYRLRHELVSERELARAKRQKVAHFTRRIQTVDGLAEQLGIGELVAHDPTVNDTYLERIESVTREQIREAVRNYIRDDNLTVVALRPPGSSSTPSSPTKLIAAEPAREVLANGIVLLTQQIEQSSLLSIVCLFHGGLRSNPVDRPGLSEFMVRMLLRGTEGRSRQEILDEIEGRGGTISMNSGFDSFGCSIVVMKDDLEIALDILADLLMNPAFSPDEIERERQEILSQIRSQREDWLLEATVPMKVMLYREHPYSHTFTGTEESVQQMSRDDLVQYHTAYCVPNNMILGIVGDFDADAVRKAVLRTFERFEPGEAPMPTWPDPYRSLSDSTVRLETEKPQAVMCLGFPGARVGSPDVYALEVLDAVLAGVDLPTGRLHSTLRGQQLVYVVHANHRWGQDPGFFMIYAATGPDKIDTVLTLIHAHIDSLQTHPIDSAELESAKSQWRVSLSLIDQTNVQKAYAMVAYELLGLGYRFGSTRIDEIERVTREDVQRVANTYLNRHVLALTVPKERTRAAYQEHE
jgi:zinc protease